MDDRLGTAPPERGRIEDVEVAGAAVGIVDHRQEPAFVVGVPVRGADEEGLGGPAPRTGFPGADVVACQVELEEADRRAALAARIPGDLDAVAVPEGRAFAARVDAGVLEVAVVDLGALHRLA